MNKMLNILAVICLLSFGFVANSNAKDFQWGFITSETIDLLGVSVNNPGGQKLGTINAFIIDSQGRVDFAILWQHNGIQDTTADRYVAVPFSSLSITRTGPAQVTVVLNMEKGAMDSAPSFDGTNDLNNTEWAARIYHHFGQAPYWTEDEAGKHVHPRIRWN